MDLGTELVKNTMPNGLELSGPAKARSEYRAAVAGSGEWLGGRDRFFG